jgi:hypothetical protein
MANSHKIGYINVDSNIENASVWINGIPSGNTPTQISVNALNAPIEISVSAEGYSTEIKIVEKYMSGWFWGNLLLGGIPGMAVDAITGGMWAVDNTSLFFNLLP